jgi:hypothetical protein
MSQHLWLRRNDLIHGDTLTHPKVIVAQTKQAIVDFTLAHKRDEAPMIARVKQTKTSWKDPMMGWAKANCDWRDNMVVWGISLRISNWNFELFNNGSLHLLGGREIKWLIYFQNMWWSMTKNFVGEIYLLIVIVMLCY